MKLLFDIVSANRQGKKRGIYSVCCAQPLIIEAAMKQSKQSGSIVLIEATANQVNQYGGYTGMSPIDFVNFVEKISKKVDFPMSRVILGGDHLGPVCWVDEPYESAKIRSEQLIESYVNAGFKKIHLDTSMPCLDDPQVLTDDIVADRAAHLCLVAEKAALKAFGHSDICYVIGTEVPPPGGATEEIDSIEVTPKARVQKTLVTHEQAFKDLRLVAAWQRVIALVVQPGVEFDHIKVFDFEPSKVTQLAEFVTTVPNIVFEAHSTDYQRPSAYKALVASHFAILKVGPQLTFAMREAIFALSHIEEQLFDVSQCSKIRETFELEMQANPNYWQKFYEGNEAQVALLRKYSFSDRIRYYWNTESIELTLEKLLTNFEKVNIPLPLISQYLPEQYLAVREGQLSNDARSLIIDKIQAVMHVYDDACS